MKAPFGPQVRLLLGDVPADVGALGIGDADGLGRGEPLDDELVDELPQRVNNAVAARDERLVGVVQPVVAERAGGGPPPVRPPGLARVDGGVAGAVLQVALQQRRFLAELDALLHHEVELVGDLAPAVGGAVLLLGEADVGDIQPVDVVRAEFQQGGAHGLQHQLVLVGIGQDQHLIALMDRREAGSAVPAMRAVAGHGQEVVDGGGAWGEQVAGVARGGIRRGHGLPFMRASRGNAGR